METLYIRDFDNFLNESRPFAAKEVDRHNANDILVLMNSNRDFGLICASTATSTSSENKERLKNLQKDIAKMNYNPIPFKYGYSYPGEGNCVIRTEEDGVFVSGIELTELLALGNTYEQDVVVFGNSEEVKSFSVSSGKCDVMLDAVDRKLALATILFYPGTFRGR